MTNYDKSKLCDEIKSSKFLKGWGYKIQCHIKARALRAAAHGPYIKKGPESNVSFDIFNMKH
jgi:hypothetical protein